MITYNLQLSSDYVQNMYAHTQILYIKTVLQSENLKFSGMRVFYWTANFSKINLSSRSCYDEYFY